MTEILDELEDLARDFDSRGKPLNAQFLRDLKGTFTDMAARLDHIEQPLGMVPASGVGGKANG